MSEGSKRPGFTRLAVKGYRRLRAVDIPLRPINVLIGANGVGKTSILEVLHLLSRAADGKLQATISELGGMASILTADGKTNELVFRSEMDHRSNEGGALAYAASVRWERLGYVVSTERLLQYIDFENKVIFDLPKPHNGFSAGDGGFSANFIHSQQETALAQTAHLPNSPEYFTVQKFSRISPVYHGLDVSPRSAVRTPQTISPAQTPGLNGEDLVSCLYTIRETKKDRFEAIENALRIAFPTFESLNFPAVAAGRLTLAWRDRNFSRPFDIGELSEGTLRFLWLTTLLQSPGLPEITLIDEPEVSLHPEMLQILTELMREASSRTQLFVATHSDRFISFLRPEEVLVCDYDDTGGMTAKWADSLDLKDWLEDYTLDQLWGKGILGGRS